MELLWPVKVSLQCWPLQEERLRVQNWKGYHSLLAPQKSPVDGANKNVDETF